MRKFHDSLQYIRTVVQNFKDPMEASETIKKFTHPLLLSADDRTKEKLLQLMAQAEMLHEYQTDIIRFRDPITGNVAEQNIRQTILDLVNSI